MYEPMFAQIRPNDGGGVPFRPSSRVCGFELYTPVQLIPHENMLEEIFGGLQDWLKPFKAVVKHCTVLVLLGGYPNTAHTC